MADKKIKTDADFDAEEKGRNKLREKARTDYLIKFNLRPEATWEDIKSVNNANIEIKQSLNEHHSVEDKLALQIAANEWGFASAESWDDITRFKDTLTLLDQCKILEVHRSDSPQEMADALNKKYIEMEALALGLPAGAKPAEVKTKAEAIAAAADKAKHDTPPNKIKLAAEAEIVRGIVAQSHLTQSIIDEMHLNPETPSNSNIPKPSATQKSRGK